MITDRDLVGGRGTMIMHMYGIESLYQPRTYKNIRTGQTSSKMYVVAEYRTGTWTEDVTKYLTNPKLFVKDLMVSIEPEKSSPTLERAAFIFKLTDWQDKHVSQTLDRF